METERIRLFVELIMRQLKGFVPKGEAVRFSLEIDTCKCQRVEFTVVQCFGEEDQLPPQIESLTGTI